MASCPPDEPTTSVRPSLADRLSQLLGRPAASAGRGGGVLAERAREAEERFKALFESCREGVLLCDERGAILDANPALVELLGEPRDRITGALARAYLRQGEGPLEAAPADGEARAYRNRRWPFPVDLRVATATAAGRPCAIVHVRDLREQHSRLRAQDRLARMSSVDELTNLPNRAQFRACLARAMERARRSNEPMALMFLDLDRFKVVNDSLGHEAGDRLLQHVAHTLTSTLRSADIVGRAVDPAQFTLSRLGGDEFTVIAESVGSAEDAGMVARRMLEALSAPFTIGEEEIVISASIGISMYPTDDVDLDGLVRHADMAMYRSKALGRNTFAFYSDDLDAIVTARLSLEGSLRRALERSEFLLHYQPKACLKTGDVTGVEALLRWECPGRGMVPPDRFISVLEDTGLILQIGAWVLRTSCAQLAAWDRQGLPPLRMAVNLSARQFRQPHLCSLIEETLREHGIAPNRLELELTESLLMEDNEVTRGMLAGFARIGVRVAIDDFGTGHSSLSYLKRFNVDTLKIDRSFVNGLPESPEDGAIARAVVALGRTMQMRVVAEGVETEGQAAFLRDIGCDEMQGYLLSSPKPLTVLEDWLHARMRRAHHVPVRPPGFEPPRPAADDGGVTGTEPAASWPTSVPSASPGSSAGGEWSVSSSPGAAAPLASPATSRIASAAEDVDAASSTPGQPPGPLKPLTLAFPAGEPVAGAVVAPPVYWVAEAPAAGQPAPRVASAPGGRGAGVVATAKAGAAPRLLRAGWRPRAAAPRPDRRTPPRRRGPGSSP